MASLVEREAVTNEDRAKVARVFYNRLEQGMPLQSDATVAYANNITGRVFTTDAEREDRLPVQHLPQVTGWQAAPGPITSPARAAMEAAVNPAEGNWLYFVVVNLDTGETEFNDDLATSTTPRRRSCRTWCRDLQDEPKPCQCPPRVRGTG